MTDPASSPRRDTRTLHLMADFTIGGGETILLSHVRHADRDRFSVQLAYLHGQGENVPAARAAGVEPVFVDWERYGDIGTVRRLVRLVKDHDIQLVHVHTALDRRLGQAAALLAGVPVVGHLHGMYNHLDHPRRGSAMHRLRAAARVRTRVNDRIERRVVHRYVAASHVVADLFRPWVTAPIDVIRPGIDPSLLATGPEARRAARQVFEVDDGDEVVIDVARLVRNKGHDHLLRAAAMLAGERPRLRVVVVGDGPERAALEREAAELGITGLVRFVGARTDATSLLAGADIFAFPSSYTEGLPVAPMEAMGAGLPVVAYAIPAMNELVADRGTALLAEVGDVTAFATALRALLEDPERRTSMGEAARAMIAERYPPDATARDIEAAYTATLGPVANRRRRSPTAALSAP